MPRRQWRLYSACAVRILKTGKKEVNQNRPHQKGWPAWMLLSFILARNVPGRWLGCQAAHSFAPSYSCLPSNCSWKTLHPTMSALKNIDIEHTVRFVCVFFDLALKSASKWILLHQKLQKSEHDFCVCKYSSTRANDLFQIFSKYFDELIKLTNFPTNCQHSTQVLSSVLLRASRNTWRSYTWIRSNATQDFRGTARW